MTALKQAMTVDDRRQNRLDNVKKEEDEKPDFKYTKFDILGKIKSVYDTLFIFFKKTKSNTVEFSQIVPSKEKKDIVWTFVPLLHLANEGKVELIQDKPFGKLHIELKDKDLLTRPDK